jgi:hypothetical protein
MWFTGINYKLAVEKDRYVIFTTITAIWKPGLSALISDVRKVNFSQLQQLRCSIITMIHA